jgi:hypothetical protein
VEEEAFVEVRNIDVLLLIDLLDDAEQLADVPKVEVLISMAASANCDKF